jgi:hypothetical protein
MQPIEKVRMFGLTFLNSQRGDSGSISINTICVKAGNAATPNIHLHVPGA